MAAAAPPAQSDRSDLRTVLLGGVQLGVLTAGAVVLFLATSRLVTVSAALRRGGEAVIVLAAGAAVSFLPGQWSRARAIEGIAGAAAIGLVGTVVFSVIDVVLLRPLRAYPWTWDAIGGGSSWWYLPVWWMLGTFLAWMGAVLTARQAARGEATLGRSAGPTLVASLVAVALARLAGLGVELPVLVGGAWSTAIALLAVVALARKG